MALVTEELLNAAREFAGLARATGADFATLRIGADSEFDFTVALEDEGGSMDTHYEAVRHEAD